MRGSMFLEKISEAKIFFIAHLGISLFMALLVYFSFGVQTAINFNLGQLVLWLSLGSLGVSLYLFFFKKSIALLIALIVLKWPILILIVYKLTHIVAIDPLSFSLGFTPVFLSALIAAKLWKV